MNRLKVAYDDSLTRLALSIANFAIAATNFSLANFFKTFRQFGETLLMVSIVSIRRQILVLLYFITVTLLGLTNDESQK